METLDPEAGAILLVDKPLTWTSFNVVAKLRGALHKLCGHRVKVGHAGTLDPLATGLLILGTGRMTKLLPGLTEHDKEYTATLLLGATTASYDAETPALDERPWQHIDTHAVAAVLPRFTGAIMQRPPNFSAKRFQGERAYNLSRWGEPLELQEVPVSIHRLELLGMEGREVHVRVACSKGTYIRSLAHDIGQALGCGAYLTALRRTRSGSYDIANARTPDEWSAWLDQWILERKAADPQGT